MAGISQDWNEVVITKKKPAAGSKVTDVDAVRLGIGGLPAGGVRADARLAFRRRRGELERRWRR